MRDFFPNFESQWLRHKHVYSINPFPNKPFQYKSFENTVRNGEIARNEQFLLFPQCFLPFWRTYHHFHKIQNCRLLILSVWKGLKFVVWERVKTISVHYVVYSHMKI